MRRKQTEAAVRITSAPRAHSEDVSGRQRRYLISMGLRTLCFLLAVAFMGTWAMWLFLAASVFLPSFAVIVANGGAAPDPDPDPTPYDAARDARQLGS